MAESRKRRLSILLASLLLASMLLLMLGPTQNDALTYDEPEHITAGYTYLRFRDARLNVEHPPLVKLLAAAPLLIADLNFPLTSPEWLEAQTRQGQIANLFVYRSGNNPRLIRDLARLGPMVLTILLGASIFVWTRKRYGDATALLVLFFYASCLTIPGHGRLVTTDVAAAFGATLTGFALIGFLEQPGSRRGLVLGLALGLALLGKFSTILLLPWCVGLVLLRATLEPGRTRRALGGLAIAGSSAAALVLCVYLWITADYAPAQQLNDTYTLLMHQAGGPAGKQDEPFEDYFNLLQRDRTRDLRACLARNDQGTLTRLHRCSMDAAIFVADKPVVRAWSHFFVGVLLTGHRVGAGGTTDFPFYLMGEVSGQAWWYYFPLVYALRESLAFHALTGVAFVLALTRVWRGRKPGARGGWFSGSPATICLLGWIGVYWLVTINANLNLGLRHLLPVFPMTMILVRRELGRWVASDSEHAFKISRLFVGKATFVVVLLGWHVMSVAAVYPHVLAYFNEWVSGPAAGAYYVTDFDWGQDLARLRDFVEARRIPKMALDYAGTASPAHELGTKYVPWKSAKGPYKGWLSISVGILTAAQGHWDPAVEHQETDSYTWLANKQSTATIGHTILVFDLRGDRSQEVLQEQSPGNLRSDACLASP
jgi:4-amino-4-deoxy-L-arabinose transferase-like glycosyltransferase